MNNYNLALNPFKKGKKGEIEGVREVGVEGDSELVKVIEMYESWSETDQIMTLKQVVENSKDIILTPEKINKFFNYMNNITPGNSKVHLYTAGLIKNSHNTGYNDFLLDNFYEEGKSTIWNTKNLRGDEFNRLNITFMGKFNNGFANSAKYANLKMIGDIDGDIGFFSEHCRYEIKGNVGYVFGSYGSNLDVIVNGNVGDDFGFKMKESKVKINGNTGENLGNTSSKCEYEVTKNVGNDLGYESEECKYVIYGDIIGNHVGDSISSTYQTPNKNTYEKMLKCVSESNAVQLLGPDGEVLEEVRK